MYLCYSAGSIILKNISVLLIYFQEEKKLNQVKN
jgi:hypothetical protein